MEAWPKERPSDSSEHSTQFSLRQSIEVDSLDTDEYVEPRIIHRSQLLASRSKASPPDLLKKSFRQELERLGKLQIPEKNPNKSRAQSPELDEDKSPFPFQRRARSNSPVRDDLNLSNRPSIEFFPSQGPVKASKPVAKRLYSEPYTGCESSSPDINQEDGGLEALQAEYSKLLEQSVAQPEPQSRPKKSKITFM